MPEILGFTSKKMIFEIENWYICVVFSTNRTNLLNWLIKSANQRRELLEVADRSGWLITEIYEDAGISGAKGRDKHPAFDKLLKDGARRKFDIVAAWSVDRLGRSLQDLVNFLSDIHCYGIDLYLHQQGIDTTTPAGKAMFQMLGVFAEFERAMIRDRVNAGLARAKANGVILGRPQTNIRIEE